MVVAELERALLERFPREDAEGWDKVGMSVGRPSDDIRSVAISLDPTPSAIRAARDRGANVLVSHHPIWINAPETLAPSARDSSYAGAALYAAAECGVSVISLHTNLDRSRAARELLPSLMGLVPDEGSLEHPDDPAAPGIGALCTFDSRSLEELARRAAEAFGGAPRVWGPRDALVRRAAVVGGSLGDFGERAVRCGADVVIAGEAGYHVCQDVAERGASLILLGHDRSETPFTRILRDAASEAGVEPERVEVLESACPWWTASKGELA